LDGELWLWWNHIDYALEQTRMPYLTVDISGASIPVRTDTPESRKTSSEALATALKRLTNRERLEFLGRLPALFDVPIPAKPPARWAPMTWEEVRSLSRDAVEFGAHTRTHPILSRLSTRDELVAEIGGSKERIEDELRTRVRWFCYPNGSAADITEETVAVVADCGFELAVTTERAFNCGSENPYLLNRIGVDPDVPFSYFTELLAGVRKQ
jgi:peptidoglycan/xylan/chitin deacetylase (PgdA/CDA1 family)